MFKKPKINEIKPDIKNANIYLRSDKKFGKEMPVSVLVLTTKGWKSMGDIQVGDYVFGSDGNPYPVLDIFPQGVKDVYRIEFEDGTVTRCGLEHNWIVKDRSESDWKVLNLKEILDSGFESNKFSIPVARAIQSMIPDSYDNEEFLSYEERKNELIRQLSQHGKIVDQQHIVVETSLDNIELLIPIDYLARSLGCPTNQSLDEMKLALHCSDACKCIITVNSELEEELSKELDFEVRAEKNDKKAITRITKYGQEESKCITVASPDGSFIVENFIVTHNTTLFRDVVLEKYNDPSKGLLVMCGMEKGATMLDDLNVVEIESYGDFLDLSKWLIEQKGIEHNIEMVCFDTVDQLVDMAEVRTLSDSFKDNPKKPKPKTINGAFGGYGAGARYAANRLLKPAFAKLQKNFGLWAIAHARWKPKKEKGASDDEAYMVFTSNLSGEYESMFGDTFDIVLTGVKEGDYEEKLENRGGEQKTVRYLTNVTRKLYFRGDGVIDAGGRIADYAGIPDYMIFKKGVNNAKKFIEIIESGMEKSKVKYRKLKDYDSSDEGTSNTSRMIIDAEPVEEEIAEKVVEDSEEIEEEIIELEESDESDDVDDIFSEEEDEEPEDKIELAKQVSKMFSDCKDKVKRKEIRAMINGSAIDTPYETLVEIKRLLEEA